MNRAFLIVFAPAVFVSSCWIAFLWGLRAAVPAGLAEIALLAGVYAVLRRRKPSEAGRV